MIAFLLTRNYLKRTILLFKNNRYQGLFYFFYIYIQFNIIKNEKNLNIENK
jgi:hypothetical protein